LLFVRHWTSVGLGVFNSSGLGSIFTACAA
jgi:hypothetical protein